MSSTVRSIMTREVTTVEPHRTIFEAANLMNKRGVGCLIVVDHDGKPVGIITERDVLRRVVAAGTDPRGVKVAEVMSKPLITAGPETSIREAARIMVGNRIRRLPIVEGSMLIGVVTSTDLAKHLSEQRQALGQVMALVDSPKVGENQASCESFKADPDLPAGQVWNICGACYWYMDSYCIREPVRLVRNMSP